MKQEKNIDYFQIEGTPGGNQEWCTDFWMYLGGCGALGARGFFIFPPAGPGAKNLNMAF